METTCDLVPWASLICGVMCPTCGVQLLCYCTGVPPGHAPSLNAMSKCHLCVPCSAGRLIFVLVLGELLSVSIFAMPWTLTGSYAQRACRTVRTRSCSRFNLALNAQSARPNISQGCSSPHQPPKCSNEGSGFRLCRRVVAAV